jgi:hypothetical protein
MLEKVVNELYIPCDELVSSTILKAPKSPLGEVKPLTTLEPVLVQ